MTELQKSDDHIQNHEVNDTPKPLVSSDASAVRNASGAEIVDARKGNNQDGSAWLDKGIPKPVDYKSIRLVNLGTIAQLSKVQRGAESLKPKSEQHITFNELLTLEKAGNLDARHLVNEIDAAYQFPSRDLKKATLSTIQDTADRVFQRGQYAESLRDPSLPSRSDSGCTFMMEPRMPIRQLSKSEKIEEDAKSHGQKHLTPLELEGAATRGDKHAALLSKEIDVACSVSSPEQRNSILADVQNRADRYYRRGEYFIAPAQESKPGVIDQFKSIIGGVFSKEQKREEISEPTVKPEAGEQVKKPLQGHLEVNQVDLKQTFMNAANASIDKQYSDLGPAALRGVGQAVTNVGETLVFGASAAADGVKLMGQTFNYDYEAATGKLSADASAQVVMKSESDWIKRYAAPVAQGIEKSLEPMTKDAEDIGFTGDYERLATDPIKYVGEQYEQFSSQTAPKQVEQLTTFGAENFLTGELIKSADHFAEAAKGIGGAAGKSMGDAFADLATPALKIVTPDGTTGDNFIAMSKANKTGSSSELPKPGMGGFPEPLDESGKSGDIVGEATRQIQYKIEKYSGRPQRTDLGKLREPYKWKTMNEHFSSDVIRQSLDDSCVAAAGEMITVGEFPEKLLLEKLATPSDIDSLAKQLGDGWSSAERKFKSFAEIGEHGPWAAQLFEPCWPKKTPHVVAIDGLNSAGNVVIRDPLEGTKYEMDLNYFVREIWTGKAAYRTKPK
ncbi:MAG: hypothetical protein P4L53_20625 [Candidatus Obscuribacterales bacterium]|nr:hypothetical protein [Candidatus Obscuribacterales bacterium]